MFSDNIPGIAATAFRDRQIHPSARRAAPSPAKTPLSGARMMKPSMLTATAFPIAPMRAAFPESGANVADVRYACPPKPPIGLTLLKNGDWLNQRQEHIECDLLIIGAWFHGKALPNEARSRAGAGKGWMKGGKTPSSQSAERGAPIDATWNRYRLSVLRAALRHLPYNGHRPPTLDMARGIKVDVAISSWHKDHHRAHD